MNSILYLHNYCRRRRDLNINIDRIRVQFIAVHVLNQNRTRVEGGDELHRDLVSAREELEEM